MDTKRNNLLLGIVYGALGATALVVVLTILGELISPLKTLLAELHHHHWVGKGVWALILCVVIIAGVYMGKKDVTQNEITKAIQLLTYVLIGTVILLFLFFTYEYTLH